MLTLSRRTFKALSTNLSKRNAYYLFALSTESSNCAEHRNAVLLLNCRRLSFIPQKKKNFIQELLENVRKELSQNQELKENLKKFREEAAKLEKSESLQAARNKYAHLEAETLRSSSRLKANVEALRDRINECVDAAQRSEAMKRVSEVADEISKQAKDLAEAASKSGVFSKDGALKLDALRAVVEGVRTVSDELNQKHSLRNQMYKPLHVLRKRKEHVNCSQEIAPDPHSSQIKLHKDSVIFESWEKWKNSSATLNRLYDWKCRVDESENVAARGARFISHSVYNIFSSVFTNSEVSEVMTQILKTEPTFTKARFLEHCHANIIPNILEALLRGDLDILKDWCHEAAFGVLSTPIKQHFTLGYHLDSQLLDISNIDIVSGKMMEQGPVLVITFESQQIMSVKNSVNEVVEGDDNKVLRMQNVWVLCRDREEFNPLAAWRLIDISMQAMNN